MSARRLQRYTGVSHPPNSCGGPCYFPLLSKSFIMRDRITSPSCRHVWSALRAYIKPRVKGLTISGNSETHDSATVLYKWQKLNLRRCSSDHNDANISKTFCCAPGCKERPSYTAHTDSLEWKAQLRLRSRSMSRKPNPFIFCGTPERGQTTPRTHGYVSQYLLHSKFHSTSLKSVLVHSPFSSSC